MKRGELYRVTPIYSAFHDLSSQVEVGEEHGLKHASSIHCDELVSLPRYVNRALAIALGLVSFPSGV